MKKEISERTKPRYDYYRFKLCKGKIVLKNAHIAFKFSNTKQKIDEVLIAI